MTEEVTARELAFSQKKITSQFIPNRRNSYSWLSLYIFLIFLDAGNHDGTKKKARIG